MVIKYRKYLCRPYVWWKELKWAKILPLPSSFINNDGIEATKRLHNRLLQSSPNQLKSIENNVSMSFALCPLYAKLINMTTLQRIIFLSWNFDTFLKSVFDTFWVHRNSESIRNFDGNRITLKGGSSANVTQINVFGKYTLFNVTKAFTNIRRLNPNRKFIETPDLDINLCIHAYFTKSDIQLKIKLSGFMRIFLYFKSNLSYITLFQRWENRVLNEFSWTPINFLLWMGKSVEV